MSVLIVHTKGDGILGETTAQDVQATAKAVAAAKHAVIHLHGGLVTKKTGTAGAARLDSYYRDSDITPVFFVWESGVLETVLNNAGEIFDKKLFQSLLKRLLKHAAGKLAQEAGGRGLDDYTPISDGEAEVAMAQARSAAASSKTPEPMQDIRPASGLTELSPAEERLLREELAGSNDFQDAVDATVLGLGVQPPADHGRAGLPPVEPEADSLLSKDIQDELRASASPGGRGFFDPASLIVHAVKILARIVRRFIQKRDHGFYTTVVEEILRELYIDAIGRRVWGSMKEDTRQTFDEGTLEKPRGGSLFLRELGEQMTARKAAGQDLPKLSIVAHSAGTIWACHFLQKFSDLRAAGSFPADFRLHRLIFLAAACQTRVFAGALRKHAAKALFDDFRHFGLSDQLESGYWEAPPLYPRSLLYMVSGLFEDEVDEPLAGMQRFLSLQAIASLDDSKAVRLFLGDPETRTVWSSINRGEGLHSDALKHGSFDDTDPAGPSATMASVKFLIKH